MTPEKKKDFIFVCCLVPFVIVLFGTIRIVSEWAWKVIDAYGGVDKIFGL